MAATPRQKAISNMLEIAKEGDMNALQDLIALLKPSDNPQILLSEIYLSSNVSDKQREFIALQKHLFSKTLLSRQILSTVAKQGDLEALKDIIHLMKHCDSKDRSWAADILRDIFISKSSTSEQKKIIWLQKDVVVHIRIEKHWVHHEAKWHWDSTYNDYVCDSEEGWSLEYKEIPVTFREYVESDIWNI